ncbi:plasmodesmata callose-binding protein 5, partial [Prunus dulcis]
LAFCLLLSLSICNLIRPPWPGTASLPWSCGALAKNNAEDAQLQSALDWACGAGGADCSPIQQGGPCYDSTDIQNTASYVIISANSHPGSFPMRGYGEGSVEAFVTQDFAQHYWFLMMHSLSSTNATLSSPSTAYGMGPSEDLNGSNQISQLWIWHLMTSLLLIAFSWVIG